ncbi:hypothetical protein EYC84_003725 [Monilinia fructicola]|uniref:Uncharacterized protein n=1 Tax=Monilinia fructicola TaxID=38448 RepID=A0A5M9JX50_MONFR|nr:hypothetical protein EYC84_003725 [Monilinia fructicola]
MMTSKTAANCDSICGPAGWREEWQSIQVKSILARRVRWINERLVQRHDRGDTRVDVRKGWKGGWMVRLRYINSMGLVVRRCKICSMYFDLYAHVRPCAPETEPEDNDESPTLSLISSSSSSSSSSPTSALSSNRPPSTTRPADATAPPALETRLPHPLRPALSLLLRAAPPPPPPARLVGPAQHALLRTMRILHPTQKQPGTMQTHPQTQRVAAPPPRRRTSNLWTRHKGRGGYHRQLWKKWFK